MMEAERTLFLACPTVRDELDASLRSLNTAVEIRYLNDNYHSFPDKLRDRLQQELDAITGYERVVLGFGFCGNAVLGLKNRDYELIIPRMDDCISMCLGSYARRRELDTPHPNIYLSRGWLGGKRGTWAEYEHMKSRLDEDTLSEIFRSMYKGHDRLYLLETGAYDLEELEEQVRQYSAVCGLDYSRIQGSLSYFRALLSGPWGEDRYIVLPPHGIVRDYMLML